MGPEKPLVDGLVDYLNEFNIKVFGHRKIASQLEGSKYLQKLCKKFKMPTARFGIFENKNDAEKHLINTNFPIVIKADTCLRKRSLHM